MKTSSSDLRAHLASRTATSAEIWRLARADSTILGFTSFNRSLVFDGLTYYPSRGGFSMTSISAMSDFSSGNLELDGFIDSQAITKEDLLLRKYDGAVMTIATVNYKDLGMGSMVRLYGKLGEVMYEDNRFKVEVLGSSKSFQQRAGRTIEKTCQVREFCDTECGLNAADYTHTGYVFTPNPAFPRRIFVSSVDQEADYFKYGQLTWLTGNNTDYQVEVANQNGEGAIELFETMPFSIQLGDQFSIIGGCDREAETCKTKWLSNNIGNFRGYGLFLPGRSGLLDYPDTTS